MSIHSQQTSAAPRSPATAEEMATAYAAGDYEAVRQALALGVPTRCIEPLVARADDVVAYHDIVVESGITAEHRSAIVGDAVVRGGTRILDRALERRHLPSELTSRLTEVAAASGNARALTALIDAGVTPNDPALIECAKHQNPEMLSAALAYEWSIETISSAAADPLLPPLSRHRLDNALQSLVSARMAAAIETVIAGTAFADSSECIGVDHTGAGSASDAIDWDADDELGLGL